VSGLNPQDVVELKNTLGNMAELLMTYYKELQGQGFRDEQALRIVIGWQRVILSQPSSED
jgi:hypothetical protein